MNHHHHHPQIPSKNPEQDSSLPAASSGYRKISLPLLRRCISDPYNPPSASTANNSFENSVPASRSGGSSPNMSLPSPDRHDFPKIPSHSPARVLPPLPPPPHALCRSVSDLNHSPAKTSSRSSTSFQDFHISTDLDTPDSKGLSRMNHHHPRQIPEQDSSLPPSASTANNPFENCLPASRCGCSLPKITTPYSPDRYYFSKTPSYSPAQVLPHLPPHTLRRSVLDLNHSPAKTSSRSFQDFHFSTGLDSPDYKGLSRMKDRLRETCKIPPFCRTLSACANSEEESAFPETVYRKIPPLRRCFSEPYKLPSATTDQPFGWTPNLNCFQPAPVVPARVAPVVPARAAPVVPARATTDPTFLLSLMALYMALCIDRPCTWHCVLIGITW